MSEQSLSVAIPSKPNITDIIIYALRQEYEPLISWDPATLAMDNVEFKTTTELMEEIEGFGSTDVDSITRAMLHEGFTIRTIDGTPFWLLRKI